MDKHAFDRTLNPNFNPKNDWLRCELAYALKKGKNVIPIFLAGINGFPDNLPSDVAGVVKMNGQEYNKFYFNDFYKTLKLRFLHSKKRPARYITLVFTFILTLLILGMSFHYLTKNIVNNPIISNEVATTPLSSTEKKNDTDNAYDVPPAPNQEATTPPSSAEEKDNTDNVYGVPPAPKYSEAKIYVPKPDYFDDDFSQCEMAKQPYYSYVISSQELGDDLLEVTMQEEDTRVRSTFYINKDRMSNAELSWIPYVVIDGNKVKIEYYYEGNGGYQQVITMENLRRK